MDNSYKESKNTPLHVHRRQRIENIICHRLVQTPVYHQRMGKQLAIIINITHWYRIKTAIIAIQGKYA